MLTRTLKVFWAGMALTPLLVFLYHGTGIRLIAAGFLYVFGGALLWIALARDPHAEGLRVFGQSAQARWAGAGVLLLFQVGIMVNGRAMLIVSLLCAVGFFAVWAWCRTAEALTKTVENLLLMSASLGFMLVLGEVVFRLPPIVARTGGNTPGMERWEQKNYELGAIGGRFRSQHLSTKKPAGVFRFLTLGDSYTWGDKIPRIQDTWPHVLERLLNKKDRPVQVINLGLCGFTTVNEAEVLERKGWSFNPDLVILEFTLNDTLPSGPNYEHVGEEWYFRTLPLLPFMHRTLDRCSYFYSFLNSRFQSIQIERRYSDGVAPLFADNFDGWKACQNAIRNMAQQARKRNVPMLGVVFPYFVSNISEPSYPYLELHRKVKSAMEKAGVPVLDLQPVYAGFGRDGRSWHALPCDAHPNVEAHSIAADAIAKKLEELRFLPDKFSDRR
jgi:lysophospholipase L1-like esterase